jgi:hypothetical protein
MKSKSNWGALARQVGKADQMARREFMKRCAAAGMICGLPPFLLSCGSGSSTVTEGSTETRTLFFNLAHEKSSANKMYFLIGGGNKIQLTSNSAASHVLANARATNTLLRAVPDDQITHYVENAVFSESAVTLCRVISPIDESAGTWSLSMLYLHIPDTGAAYAFAQAPKPLTLSAKRDRYGISAALTEQDIRDENVLIDSSSHAATLIMLHPSMSSREPNSAHHIYTTHASVGIATKKLTQTLIKLGAALPQIEPGQPNGSGWATLRMLIDANTDTPIKNLEEKNTERIRYFPDWSAAVDEDAKRAIKSHVNNVRHDANLHAIPASSKILARHKWAAAANPNGATPAAMNGQNLKITFVDQISENGPGGSASFNFDESGNTIMANINLFAWRMPYLSVFLQFLDDKHPSNVIPPNTIAAYPSGISDPGQNKARDADSEIFRTTVSSEWTIYDIPVAAGTSSFLVNVPQGASRAHILAGGLAELASPNNYPQTTMPDVVTTLIMNFGLETFFYAAGASVNFRNKGAISFSA